MVNQIIEFYKQGNSLAACGRKFEKSPQTIRKILQNNNIHIRNRSEQCVIENQKRAYKVNHNYFDELDNIKAYYLGFIAADGTVRPNRNTVKIGLQGRDEDWLIQFKNDLQIEAPIKHYLVNERYPTVELSFSSAQIKQALAKYDIFPNKTYRGVSMQHIPDKYKLAFIKGYYDGDGCYTSGKIKIVSKTNGILDEIIEATNYNWYIYYFSKRDIYSLELSNVPSRQFLHDIYQLDTPCLQRKFQEYNKSTSQEPCCCCR